MIHVSIERRFLLAGARQPKKKRNRLTQVQNRDEKRTHDSGCHTHKHTEGGQLLVSDGDRPGGVFYSLMPEGRGKLCDKDSEMVFSPLFAFFLSFLRSGKVLLHCLRPGEDVLVSLVSVNLTFFLIPLKLVLQYCRNSWKVVCIE